MTIPKVTRDLLMLAPSFNLSPTAPLALARSLRKKICVKEKANNKHSLHHQLASFKLYQTHQVSPAPVVCKRLELLLLLNCKHYHPTLVQQRGGGHMTLYHQDPVATLSRPSQGASQVGAPQVSQTSNTNYTELQYIAASFPSVTTGTMKPLSIYQVSLLHKN